MSLPTPAASPSLPRLGDDLSGRAPGGRWGRLAIALYLVLSAVSVAWALSGSTTPDNPLAAEVRWDATEYPALVVTNRSREDWTGLRVELDGRYYAPIGDVPRGRSRAVSAAEFRDGFELPRPDGMYGYERGLARDALPERALGPGYRPRRVRLLAEEGQAEEELAD